MDVITDIINVVLTTAVKVWIVKLDSIKEKYDSVTPNREKTKILLIKKAIAVKM
ncbi:hypothetical protein D3C71_2185470 [compost metagenome]